MRLLKVKKWSKQEFRRDKIKKKLGIKYSEWSMISLMMMMMITGLAIGSTIRLFRVDFKYIINQLINEKKRFLLSIDILFSPSLSLFYFFCLFAQFYMIYNQSILLSHFILFQKVALKKKRRDSQQQQQQKLDLC